MPAISIFSLNLEDYNNIDWRLKPFLKHWTAIQEYKGKVVKFPGTWDSKIFPYRFFAVMKQLGEPNYKPGGEEDEIVLCLYVGWPGYDDEIDIRLHIRGSDVKAGTNNVAAEILNTGAAPIKLYYRGRKICSFNQGYWWTRDKLWIRNFGKNL
ncbi:hypothetical protein LCGC14_0380920 [marine sediment metagenome]|uniref:Uncharacterized protein n=1 Tax=marine sediment metagenome TaxID=412755 RepID=A0A0F9VPS8_9ZZZZ